MKVEDVQAYEDLECYLREFVNFKGDPVPYDFVGAYGLFLAILDNLSKNHIEADLEDLQECHAFLTEDQKTFLQRLIQLSEFGIES